MYRQIIIVITVIAAMAYNVEAKSKVKKKSKKELKRIKKASSVGFNSRYDLKF